MKNKHDKYVIECWVRLYNRVNSGSFKVVGWPDTDSTESNIDAVCQDDDGRSLAIEHTLIEPFEGEKGDAARFAATLARLENHPDLVLPGHQITASQIVNAVPTGIDWSSLAGEMLRRLTAAVPALPEGDSTVRIVAENWPVDLRISKMVMHQDYRGTFLVGRLWPGDPGSGLVAHALERKIPKLAAVSAWKKVLVFEYDAVAGTLEKQFEGILDNQSMLELLRRVDEVWSAETPALEREQTIFSHQLWPEVHDIWCSLNVQTGQFWRRPG